MRIVAVLASALAVAIALVLPVPAGAGHDNTCHPPDQPPGTQPGQFFLLIHWAFQPGNLGLSIDAQGEVRPFGALRLGASLLLPQADGSSAQCADANGNGDAGLILAEVALVDVRTGRPATALLRPGDGEDIDTSGLHAATLEVCIGSDCTRLSGELRAVVNAFRSGGTR